MQVDGLVEANDSLYASPKSPGRAISHRHLSNKEKKDSSYIGKALSNTKEGNSVTSLIKTTFTPYRIALMRALKAYRIDVKMLRFLTFHIG